MPAQHSPASDIHPDLAAGAPSVLGPSPPSSRMDMAQAAPDQRQAGLAGAQLTL